MTFQLTGSITNASSAFIGVKAKTNNEETVQMMNILMIVMPNGIPMNLV